MTLITAFTILWIVWILGFFAIELPGLFNSRRGDTLTDHVYFVRGLKIGNIPIGWLMVVPFWLWMGYHFFLEDRIKK